MNVLLQLVATLSLCQEFGQTGWQRMPSLPDSIGFAGMAAGAPGDVLIAAGGARFPGKPPWEGGSKEYDDSIWLLADNLSQWSRLPQKLHHPLAYAVSATWKDFLVIAGGETRASNNAPITCVEKAFKVRITDGKANISDLPPIPVPVAYATGTVMGSKLMVFGGITSPTATKALNNLWILDLADPKNGWVKGLPCPGPARILSVCAAINNNFYIMGGAELSPDIQGRPSRRYLRDAWRRDSDGNWHRLPDMPHAVVAAASPAPISGTRIWILSGDDGTQVGSLPQAHKGFPGRTMAFDYQNNRWVEGRPVPAPRVTLPSVPFRNRWWLISGESKPGIRSPEVWSADPTVWELP